MPADASGPEPDAAWWAVRLAAEGTDPALRQAAEAWLASAPRRAGQLLRAQAALHAATCPHAEPAQDADAAPDQPEAPPGARAAPWSRRRAIGGGALLAAGLAMAAVLLPRQGRVETDIGEIRRLPLDDGSTVALNTRTSLRVAFAERERRIVLARGEALFRVATAADRPFVVTAGTVTVTAIGTIFAVRLLAPGVEVIVTEGRVEVRDPARSPVRMGAGTRGVFGLATEPEVGAMAPEAAARALAWRDGRLEFDGEPVAEAIAEVNRHNRRIIRLTDPALGREPVYGAFRTDDPAGFARAIAATLGAEVEEGPREIRIGAAEAPGG